MSFKKAAYLPLTTPTEFIENYLFGTTFDDYVYIRILKFCDSQIKRDNDIFWHITKTRGKLRPKKGCKIGALLQKYCEIKNMFPEEYFIKIRKEKKRNTNHYFKKCLEYKPNF